MEQTKKVSFVIRTKNEEKTIGEVLRLVRNQFGIQPEIIIVDSGSKDHTLEIAEPLCDRVLKIAPEDFTWGYALNYGIKVASSPYICIISGHCLFNREDAVYHGIQVLEKNNLSAIYGKQIGDPRKNPYEYIEMKPQYPDVELQTFTYEDIRQLRTFGISNACSIIRRSAWEKQKYDEKVQSSEDGLWAEKITKQNGKIGYTSGFSVIHAHQYDYVYSYKKSFWRIFCGVQSNPSMASASDLMLRMKYTVAWPFYQTLKMRDKRMVSNMKLYHYFQLNGWAIYNAFNAVKKQQHKIMKYENLEIPEKIRKIGSRTMI